MQQVIPLPEAADLTVQLRRRETHARAARSGGGPDWTPYVIITPDGRSEPLRKRRAVLALVTALAQAGVPPVSLAEALPNSKFLAVPGRLSGDDLFDAFALAYPQVLKDPRGPRRWFFEAPLHDGESTWILSKMFGANTEAVLNDLLALAPNDGYGHEAQREA